MPEKMNTYKVQLWLFKWWDIKRFPVYKDDHLGASAKAVEYMYSKPQWLKWRVTNEV